MESATIFRMAFILNKFFIHLLYELEHRQGKDAISLFQNPINSKQIPFYFEVKLPPPLRRGVDYGFTKDNYWTMTVEK